MTSRPPLLDVRSVSKRFPGVLALDGVDLTLRAGEIHALLGENGAGKSTLIKVLTGVHPADSGSFLLNGEAVSIRSPREAERLGISTVYQEVNLIPTLSVAENLMLGRQPTRLGLIDRKALAKAARAALAKVGLACDPDAELGGLPVALQQMVAIARALDLKAQVLILDEPTASLDEREVADLFSVMRRLRSEGMGIVLVTHFLDQVYAVCDRITVLRNGQRVGDYETSSLPRMQLVAAMLGRTLGPAEGAGEARPVAHPSPGKPLLRVSDLSRPGAVAQFDLSLERGEVVGLAGLLGSGRTETARLIFGVDTPQSGEVILDGQGVPRGSTREAVRLGLAFCSEDRKSEGIFPNLSVRENLIMALQGRRGLFRALGAEEQRRLCEHYIQALAIKTPTQETPIRRLSGGNQQKVLLARWLCVQPKVIILDEPTRGIDIGAKAEIEALIGRLREDGIGVLFISSEIEEVVRVSSRILVMRERRLTGELSGVQRSVSSVMKAISGSA